MSQPRGYRQGCSGNRTAGAFTLIELMAVLLIGMLLITLAITAYTNLRRTTGVGTAARVVADNLEIARQTAMSMQVRTRYLASPGSSNYRPTHRGAVVREIPGLRDPSGQAIWQYSTEWHAVPVGVYYLGTNTTMAGGLEWLPAPTTVIGDYGSSTAVYTSGWDSVSNVWQITNISKAGLSAVSYQSVEFDPEGRPSQTWTVTVGRSGTDLARVIVDGWTGKVRVERP